MSLKRSENLSVRLDPKDMEKLRLISERECRTRSGQVMVWIRRCIREYEQVHGDIRSEPGRQ